jgi:hypothetical protein
MCENEEEEEGKFGQRTLSSVAVVAVPDDNINS